MIQIIIGNIIALLASLLMVYTGLLRKKEKFIYIQTFQMLLLAISNLILGGITGVITNIFGCIRNILCYKNKLKNTEKIILVVITSVFSLCFNNLGFIGILPLISTVTYTLLIDLKDVVKFKILVILTVILWFIYDIYIQSYTSAIFDFMTIITNTIAIYKLHYSKPEAKIS
ncbi:MAG: YgjV family protein [Clostridia bacterium]|nr:YgjV family protein [Clostridia bacterium]